MTGRHPLDPLEGVDPFKEFNHRVRIDVEAIRLVKENIFSMQYNTGIASIEIDPDFMENSVQRPGPDLFE